MADPAGVLRERRDGPVHSIEVYADISCPFAYVGLRRLLAQRDARAAHMVLRIRAWPLEWVNDQPHDPDLTARSVAALRASVAPDLFAGFDPGTYPRTTIPALGLVAVAYRAGIDVGERVSLAVREAVFEHGRAIDRAPELDAIAGEFGLERPDAALTDALVLEDWERGRARHVQGSPHFFMGDRDWFCPSLRVHHGDAGFDVSVDTTALDAFLGAVFA